MSNQHNILLVEDDAEISEMLKNYLTAENYHVVCSFDRKESLEKFNEKIFTGKANKQSNSSSLFDDADILARNFIKQVECIDGVTLYGDVGASVRTPVVALNLDGIDSGDAADMLWQEYGIAVRAGAHCAPLMHKTLGTQRTGAVRFSFSHFNKQEEVDTAGRGIKRILLKRGK